MQFATGSKPRVENQVPYVRERWCAGEKFTTDIQEIRAHAETWCRDVAGARIHGTTRRVPREVYELEEHKHMLPAPDKLFDVPVWSTAKVHPDHHAVVAYGLYSLPSIYLEHELTVRLDSTSVRFYQGLDVVKVHPRVPPGQRSTDENDYPSDKADYAFRKIDRLLARARKHGEHVGRYAERLLAGPLPWSKMRQAYGLVRLCEKFGDERVNGACARALAFDVIDVPRIGRMLKAAQKIEESAENSGKVVRLPAGRFARDASTFATQPERGDANDEGGVQ